MKNCMEKSKDPEYKANYERREKRLRYAKVMELMRDAGIPKAYQEKTFDDFVPNYDNEHALDSCKQSDVRT